MKANLQFIAQKPVQPLSIEFIGDVEEKKTKDNHVDETYDRVRQLFENEEHVKAMSYSLKQNYHKLLQLLEKQKKLERLMDKIEREKEALVS